MLGCLELLLVPAPLTDCCIHRCSDGHRAGAPCAPSTAPATVLVTMGAGWNGEHLGMGGDGEK